MRAPSHAGCMASLVPMSSQWRRAAAARVPEREDVNGLRREAVVEIVVNATEVYPAHSGKSLVSCSCAYGRLDRKKRERPLRFFFNRSGCERSILCPPGGRFLDLCSRIPCDSNPQLTFSR